MSRAETSTRGRLIWLVAVGTALATSRGLVGPNPAMAQGIAQGSPPPPTAKTIKCKSRRIPQLEDVTQKTGIRFTHTSSPESRYIVESMSGGVLLLDYDRD